MDQTTTQPNLTAASTVIKRYGLTGKGGLAVAAQALAGGAKSHVGEWRSAPSTICKTRRCAGSITLPCLKVRE